MKVSVITPSLNPNDGYLHRVFKALENQTLDKTKWEYLVVDSGSDHPLCDRLDLSWHPNARVIDAPYRALVRSRLAGMSAAVSPLFVFVDDDNVLHPDYLDLVVRLMELHPYIGVLGAYCEGEFEIPVEPWMREFIGILSAAQFSRKQLLPLQYAYTTEGGSWIPAGSGMVVRRTVYDTYRERVERDPQILEIGRINESLAGSEDTDLAFTAIAAGLAMGKSTDLKLTHLIPARRINEDYLRRLLYASNYSSERLAIRWGWRQEEPAKKLNQWQKIRHWFGRFKARTPSDTLWNASIRGRYDGRSGLPFDPAYR